MKYDPNGNQIWAVRYAGAGGDNRAVGLELDALGNVYVTWASEHPGPFDYATVKYVQHDIDGFPTITRAPEDQTVRIGTNMTFTVAATGLHPLSYQWSKDGVRISDATNATLTLAITDCSQAASCSGDYSVEVSNASGRTVSPEGRLTIIVPPPSLRSAAVLSDGTFQLTLLGSVGCAYDIQASSDLINWWSAGTVLTDQNGMGQYTDSGAIASGQGFYRAVQLP